MSPAVFPPQQGTLSLKVSVSLTRTSPQSLLRGPPSPCGSSSLMPCLESRPGPALAHLMLPFLFAIHLLKICCLSRGFALFLSQTELQRAGIVVFWVRCLWHSACTQQVSIQCRLLEWLNTSERVARPQPRMLSWISPECSLSSSCGSLVPPS